MQRRGIHNNINIAMVVRRKPRSRASGVRMLSKLRAELSFLCLGIQALALRFHRLIHKYRTLVLVLVGIVDLLMVSLFQVVDDGLVWGGTPPIGEPLSFLPYLYTVKT